jgi:hypothetical protein
MKLDNFHTNFQQLHVSFYLQDETLCRCGALSMCAIGLVKCRVSKKTGIGTDYCITYLKTYRFKHL